MLLPAGIPSNFVAAFEPPSQLISFSAVPVTNNDGIFSLRYPGGTDHQWEGFAATAVASDIQDGLRDIHGFESVIVTGTFAEGFRIKMVGVLSPVSLMEAAAPGVPRNTLKDSNGDDVIVTVSFLNHVAMSVYDDTGTEPVLLLSPFAMENFTGNCYRGKFTPQNGKLYLVVMAVYTDETFATLDPDYVEQVVSVTAQYTAVQPMNVVGMVQCCAETLDQVFAPFSIFLGDTKTMFLKVVTPLNGPGDPLDLTHCTEIDVALAKADGTIVHRKLTDGNVSITAPAVLGKFSVPIPDTVSALLNVGELQNFDVTFTIGAEKFTVRFENALSVFEVR